MRPSLGQPGGGAARSRRSGRTVLGAARQALAGVPAGRRPYWRTHTWGRGSIEHCRSPGGRPGRGRARCRDRLSRRASGAIVGGDRRWHRRQFGRPRHLRGRRKFVLAIVVGEAQVSPNDRLYRRRLGQLARRAASGQVRHRPVCAASPASAVRVRITLIKKLLQHKDPSPRLAAPERLARFGALLGGFGVSLDDGLTLASPERWPDALSRWTAEQWPSIYDTKLAAPSRVRLAYGHRTSAGRDHPPPSSELSLCPRPRPRQPGDGVIRATLCHTVG